MGKTQAEILDFKKDVREEIGYTTQAHVNGDRGREPWARDVMPRVKIISPCESPLKEWWKAQQLNKK